MYKQFYGLTRNPFEISPDPQFYCATPLHNEALASLLYGVKKRKGFVVTTGEVGTGKTLLIHCLLQWLSKVQISFSHIFNTRLSALEFLQYFLADLGLPSAGKNKSELLIQLNQYLINEYHKGSTTVLVVDEGQLLDWEVLEEIRLLTNLETLQQKLLQIILVGQPELSERLDSPDLRQLKQRIAFRCHLKPLSGQETQAYIAHRLEVAGASSHENNLFPEATIAAIMRYSQGIPRLINTLCENALISGYARQIHSITPEIIDQVAADACLDRAQNHEALRRPIDRHVVLRELFRMIQVLDPKSRSRDRLEMPGKEEFKHESDF